MSVNDERASLNEGFIVTDDKDDVDMSCMMSEPDLSRCHVAEGEYVSLENITRQTVSDTSVNVCDKSRGHNRSYSADGLLDGSLKNSGLRRGRPNSVKAGLCHGSEREVQKLRRSFGLDKSDIGFPIPVSVPNVSGTDLRDLDQSITSFDSGNVPSETVSCASLDAVSSVQSNSPGSVSINRSAGGLNVPGIELMDFDSEAPKISCESGEPKFSTKSDGATAMSKLSVTGSNSEMTEIKGKDAASLPLTSVVSEDKKTLVDQKYESVDSLFSEASSCSPAFPPGQREMTRSISADSGKGSICDESLTDLNSVTILESQSSEKGESDTMSESVKVAPDYMLEDRKIPETNQEIKTKCPVTKLQLVTETFSDDMKLNLQPQKSKSTHDLQQEVVRTPGVSRSKSMLDSTMNRKNNGKPNLQISAETHKLLARAGYIRDQKTDQPKEQEDFAFPGNVQFPLIKQAEVINPRRESLIALQKNKAGFVKSNVRQIEKIAEENEDFTEKYASPFRFPNSTTRKRGMSPLKIPTGLSKNDIEMASFMQSVDEKVSFGTAKLPISTQLIKPSDPVALMKHDADVSINNSSLKRKPSIYYAKREMEDSVKMKLKYTKDRNVSVNNSSIIDESLESNDMEVAVVDMRDKTTGDHEETSASQKGVLDRQHIDLNASLEETINSVCTPLSEKLIQNDDRIPKGNKENTMKPSRKMPDLKPPITTPLTVDNMTLRTGSGKTPVEVLKTAKSPRSPVKPLKRLGSPASPRCRVVRSPKLLKNRRQLLTAVPSLNEEEINNL